MEAKKSFYISRLGSPSQDEPEQNSLVAPDRNKLVQQDAGEEGDATNAVRRKQLFTRSGVEKAKKDFAERALRLRRVPSHARELHSTLTSQQNKEPRHCAHKGAKQRTAISAPSTRSHLIIRACLPGLFRKAFIHSCRENLTASRGRKSPTARKVL